MLKRQCNAGVRHFLAAGDEFDEVVAGLPASVTENLENALCLEGRVLRYDAASQTAYSIERLNPKLSVWIWEAIESYNVAAKLLTHLVEFDGPIDETAAKAAYVIATGHVGPDVG